MSSFLAPSLIGFVAFVFGPMIASFVFSFHDWNMLSPMRFVGLGNFERMFGDSLWWKSVGNTFVYSFLNIPLVIAVSLIFALIVTRPNGPASNIFKTAYFMPVVVSTVAAGIMWQWILSTDYGLLNAALAGIDLPKVGWLTNGNVAMFSVVIVVVWQWAGYYMVIMTAGLNEIPKELYEAASLDGVGGFRRFWFITLPQMFHIIFFVGMMCLIGSFQAFDVIYILTGGGPGSSTYLTGFDLYQTSFQFLKMGYGSAMAVFLFFVLLVLTMIQLRISRAVTK